MCGESITQPSRGPTRVFCTRSECRRAGAARRKLAQAWDEGYAAGSRGKPVVAAPPPPTKSHWETAFRNGAIAAKQDVLDTWGGLTFALDRYGRHPSRENRKAVELALARTRKALVFRPGRGGRPKR